MWKNTKQPNRPQLTTTHGAGNTRSACRMTREETQTLRVRNTHCYSTAKFLTRTQTNVTLHVYRLSCLGWLCSAWATQSEVRLRQLKYLMWLFFQDISINFSCSFVCFRRESPQWTRASSFMRFLDHTQWRTTVGRTPVDEWSDRRRDLHLTTRNNHNRQTSMFPVGFEPTISAAERPQTYALDRAATGTDTISC